MKSCRPIIFLGVLLLLLTECPLHDQTPDPFVWQRKEMVETQLKNRGIKDPRVLESMTTIPRHLFVEKNLADDSYGDFPLPIGEGQTISQPYVVAFMTESLRLTGHEKILEIGTGSGYQAALLSQLTQEVLTIEIRPNLARMASDRLTSMGYSNVSVKTADGYYGWEEKGPFDAIMVTAAVNHVPPPLLSQLKNGGRLILPLGSTDFFQTLTMITKDQSGKPESTHLISVRFVPLVGKATAKE